MSHRASEWAWRSPFTLGTRLVLLCLANYAGESGITWISIETMVEDCRLSKTSVYEGISQLIKAGWLIKGKAKLSKLVEQGLIADSKVKQPNKEVCIWRITPQFPESGKGESVQNEAEAIPESGQNFPESGQNFPESGKPPHPLKGSNRKGTVKEPKGADAQTGPRPSDGDDNGIFQSGLREGESAEERVKRLDGVRRGIVRKVFAYYCDRTDRSPQMYTLTEARMKVGLARLQDCWKKIPDGDLEKAGELLRIAVDGMCRSEFHMGKNDRNRRYTDWTDHLFKSTDKLEKWLEAE